MPHASDLGYAVMVVADACSTATRELHGAALWAMELIATICEVERTVADFADGSS